MTREEASFILANIDRSVYDELDNEALDMAIEALEREPKTGHWYCDEERGATGIYAICSNCEEEIYQTGDFNYCPNCGAKMESEGKE